MAGWIQQNPPPGIRLWIHDSGAQRHRTPLGSVQLGTGRQVKMNHRRARPRRWLVIRHPLRDEQQPWGLHPDAGGSAPQQPSAQQPQVELSQLSRVGAIERNPDETHLGISSHLSHGSTLSPDDSALLCPRQISLSGRLVVPSSLGELLVLPFMHAGQPDRRRPCLMAAPPVDRRTTVPFSVGCAPLAARAFLPQPPARGRQPSRPPSVRKTSP
jgi:hypothetical protein